ncbi:hypothetical protein SAMN02927916_2728 [Flavobacterium anhuiense]|uniref:Uncharacterized protein n=1 Tax=Flavobacterium anhuiense TaxID=459526 RepID=A0ABY0LTL7_9FLAO|nr:hypothetical protein SAMN02927916_2728 [Flavobacterium anhuiense]
MFCNIKLLERKKSKIKRHNFDVYNRAILQNLRNAESDEKYISKEKSFTDYEKSGNLSLFWLMKI